MTINKLEIAVFHWNNLPPNIVACPTLEQFNQMGQPGSPSPMVQGQTCSPIVDKSWKKRLTQKDVQHAQRNVMACGVAIFLLYIDMNIFFLSAVLQIGRTVFWYIEVSLIVVLVFSIVSDVFKCLSYYVFNNKLEVTQIQKRLLGVKDNDPGFSLSPIRSSAPSNSENSLVFSSSTPSSSHTAYSPSSHWSSNAAMTPTNLGSFNASHTYASPRNSFLSASGHASLDRSGFQTSGGHLSGFSNSSFTPYSPGASLSSLDGSGLQSRLSLSSSFRSPSPSDKMTDLQSLSVYLKEQDEKDYKAALSCQDMSLNSSSFWSYGRPSLDLSHVFRKNQYQLASRSPQSHKSRTDDSDNMGEEVWRPLGVTDDDLFLWIERLRKWLGNTIMVKLSREIDAINLQLRKIGSEDTEIGEVGVSTLKQLALTKVAHVPTLNMMVPYLDCTSNQEYMVKRIKELGSDGCVSEFLWNRGGGGGQYGKPWSEHLPTDTQLVMHMFCTYLDSRLPPDLRYPDGKTFTSQHFLKTPDKPNLEKDNLLLYQTSINPPHFQVVIKDTVFNLPKESESWNVGGQPTMCPGQMNFRCLQSFGR
ncbi:transmembrane protein 209-like isoform X2 [Mya arenaria]|uniref:transmembrane protein 209-like isoform X2 n=1 Tax=Mya arenaria TaxID=6604 RepID=UPI0022E96BF7|nr:transmembrane protein 209-like isoform X2 [Mya arenaria]